MDEEFDETLDKGDDKLPADLEDREEDKDIPPDEKDLPDHDPEDN
jgi:hypothetical protein